MTVATYSEMIIRSVGELEQYYQQCGLAPEIILPRNEEIEIHKKVYGLGDLFLCTDTSRTGWGFRKQQETDVYFFSVTKSGGAEWRIRDKDPIFGAENLCVIDSKTLISGAYLPGTTTETIMIPAVVLHAEMSVLQGYPCKHRLQFKQTLDDTSAAWKLIECIAMTLKLHMDKSIRGSPIAASYLRQALISTVLEEIPHNLSDNLDCGTLKILPKVMKRAIDFMHSEAAKPISLSDIALAAGTSVRNLQLLFKIHKDASPMNVLRGIRLMNCKQELICSEPPVQIEKIAKKWGFAHRVLFQRYYKQRFGESPEQTVLRR